MGRIMFKKIVVGIVIIIAGVLVAAALQPEDFRVERSALIAAPAAPVFDRVNNLSKFNAWSPWAKIDPNAKAVFEGPTEGMGAKFSWEGNRDVGKGSMTIVETRAGELVRFRMDFIEPIQATDTAEFTFKPESNGTRVTWSLHGKKNYLCKLVGLVLDTDKMVGSEFEKGLVNLKTAVEGSK